MGYKKTTLYGIGWAGFLQLTVRFSSFLKIWVAAMFLGPRDIGVYGLALLTLSLVEVFSETGMQAFLIQQKKITGQLMGTVWIVTLARGILLWILLMVLSYPVSLFFKQEQLFLFVFLISFIPFIKGFENPYSILLQKKLFFHKEFLYRSIYTLTDTCISLILLFIYRSLVVLFIGLIIANIVGVISSFFLISKRPRLKFKKSIFQKMRKYISFIVPMNIANFTVVQFDALFIGKYLGAGDLGIYQVTQRITSQPLIELSDVFGKVTLPVYSKIRHDQERLKRAYRKVVFTIGSLSTLIGIGIFVFAHIFINILGSAWKEGVILVPILICYGVIAAIWGSIGSLFFSLFSHHILMRISFIRLVITVPLIVFLGNYLGLIGVPTALLISMILMQPITVYYLLRLFKN